MKLAFDPSALSEIEDAAAWYEAERLGLAREFVAEVKAASQRIVEYPNAWALVGRRVRRLQLRRFPYGIIYQIRGEEVFIVAVAHLHRRPGYWEERLKDQG